MASLNERSLGVARLYARAMLEVATDQDAATSFGEELDGVLEASRRDPELALFLSSPVLKREKRRESLEKILRGRTSDLLVDSLQVVNMKDRLAILPQIIEVYHEKHRDQLGQVEVRITTAVELTEAQRDNVRERARITTGKEAYLVEKVDPDLLGGLVVQVGDQKIDMSVRRDLELLSARFAERLSTELLSGNEFSTDVDAVGDFADTSQAGRDEEE